MSKYSFSDKERFSIYTVHDEKCYLCNVPLDFSSVEIDHILPESLLDDPARLKNILHDYMLPNDFNLNSLDNWLPSCKTCNRKKSDSVFIPAPIILLQLKKAMNKAKKVQEKIDNNIYRGTVTKAIALVIIAAEERTLTKKQVENISPILELINEEREKELQNTPIKISPNVNLILDTTETYYIIKDNFGIGIKPKVDFDNSNWSCPTCGVGASWNGIRCMRCGEVCDE